MSTKIYATKGSGFSVVRDWRVVMVPDDNNTLDVLGLYNLFCFILRPHTHTRGKNLVPSSFLEKNMPVSSWPNATLAGLCLGVKQCDYLSLNPNTGSI